MTTNSIVDYSFKNLPLMYITKSLYFRSMFAPLYSGHHINRDLKVVGTLRVPSILHVGGITAHGVCLLLCRDVYRNVKNYTRKTENEITLISFLHTLTCTPSYTTIKISVNYRRNLWQLLQHKHTSHLKNISL